MTPQPLTLTDWLGLVVLLWAVTAIALMIGDCIKVHLRERRDDAEVRARVIRNATNGGWIR